MHLGVNLSPRKQKIRQGAELTLETIGLLDDAPLTRRIVASQVSSIYDPMGLCCRYNKVQIVAPRNRPLWNRLGLALSARVGQESQGNSPGDCEVTRRRLPQVNRPQGSSRQSGTRGILGWWQTCISWVHLHSVLRWWWKMGAQAAGE